MVTKNYWTITIIYFDNLVLVYSNNTRLFAITEHCSNQDQWRVSDAKSSWIVTSGLNNYKSYKHIVSTQEKKQTRSCLSDKLRLCTVMYNQESHLEIDVVRAKRDTRWYTNTLDPPYRSYMNLDVAYKKVAN